jgi:hypothetical protein
VISVRTSNGIRRESTEGHTIRISETKMTLLSVMLFRGMGTARTEPKTNDLVVQIRSVAFRLAHRCSMMISGRPTCKNDTEKRNKKMEEKNMI